jgi:glutaminyl-tRNA synthetase
VIHWVDAATSVPAEVRLYDRLFAAAKPDDGAGDFLAQLDPKSLEIVRGARLEASLAAAPIGSRWQLERVGYFVVDDDTRPGGIVLNRIVTLRDATKKETTAGATPHAEKKPSAKAATRPKSKSPAEYRAEARARDPELAERYTATRGLGLSEDQADLLSGDTATATLFATVLAESRAPAELVAKWIINEIPGDARARVDAHGLASLVRAVAAGGIANAAAKSTLATALKTGAPIDLSARAAGTGDVGAAIDAVIAANPDKAAQYKAGKTGLLGFFVGQVMRSTPNADAAAVNRAVRERLG